MNERTPLRKLGQIFDGLSTKMRVFSASLAAKQFAKRPVGDDHAAIGAKDAHRPLESVQRLERDSREIEI